MVSSQDYWNHLMNNKLKTERLHFIDAIRAWAILMMLQGHFIAALLGDSYRDSGNPVFCIWSYFRGVTAPVFFTVSGFIFTFLLVRKYDQGFTNPRVKKGVLRGLKLIVIGYILQIRFLRLVKGTINDSYTIVHVLQCLGLSLILIVLFYLFSYKFKKQVFATLLFFITLGLFIFKAQYEQWDLSLMPEFFSNYLTKENGSVFTIIPWFGFTAFGGFMALVFTQNRRKANFYRKAISSCALVGGLLIAYAYEVLRGLTKLTRLQFIEDALSDSYLFARLGVVLLVFALFMFFKKYLTSSTILKIGQLTLPIYVVHAIVLYNSIIGYGLSRFYYHSLAPIPVFLGAFCFVVLICMFVLKLNQKHPGILQRLF